MIEIKVVSKLLGGKGDYDMQGKQDELANEIQNLVNEGWEIKTSGCSSGGYGDISQTHMCFVVLQKSRMRGDRYL